MRIYFSVSELCIIGDDISLDVADKLLKYHIEPINEVRILLGCWIKASSKSGYRPIDYEKKRGRSGNSQHCFKELGAVDWTTAKQYTKRMIKLIMSHTDYLRICYYPNNNFIHCDYKDVDGGKRRYYECASPSSKWIFKKYV